MLTARQLFYKQQKIRNQYKKGRVSNPSPVINSSLIPVYANYFANNFTDFLKSFNVFVDPTDDRTYTYDSNIAYVTLHDIIDGDQTSNYLGVVFSTGIYWNAADGVKLYPTYGYINNQPNFGATWESINPIGASIISRTDLADVVRFMIQPFNASQYRECTLPIDQLWDGPIFKLEGPLGTKVHLTLRNSYRFYFTAK